MLKLFSVLSLLFCLNPVFANLNESTKPVQLNVYIEQNPPYSGFDAQQNGEGLFFDYWQLWSAETGISVKFHPYHKEQLSQLLSTNQPAVYSGLLEKTENLENLNKLPLFALNSQFYYFSTSSSKVKSSLVDQKLTIIVGGLLPGAQQLPIFSTATNIIYREYSSLLDILLDIYSGNIDALVLFSGDQDQQNSLEWALSLLFDSTSLGSSNNELFVYTSQVQKSVLNWVKWGTQLEMLPAQSALLIEKMANPIWTVSEATAVTMQITVCFILLFTLVRRITRRKDKQFENIFYSSPYPLVILSLDGTVIYFLNEQAKSSFPFKSRENRYSFIDAKHQILISNLFKNVSHLTAIEDAHIRLPIDNGFQDIAIAVKRIHYKRHTAWLCYLKDITVELKIEKTLAVTAGTLTTTEDKLTLTESQFVIAEKELRLSDEKLSVAEDKLTVTERKLAIEEKKSRFSDEKLIVEEKNLTVAEARLTATEEKLSAAKELLQGKKLRCKQFEKALFMRNFLLNTIFSVTADPIALLDHDGHVIVANNEFTQLLNANPEGLINQLESDPLSSDAGSKLAHQDKERLESVDPITFELSFLSEGKSICYEVHKTPFKDSESDCGGFAIMAQDISIRNQIEQKQIVKESDFAINIEHEQLPPIANRNAFDLQLIKLWQEACDEQLLLSVLICEIDPFKNSDDNYGDQKSEQALQSVTRVLQKACEKLDCFVAHHSDELFVVLMKGCNAHKVYPIAENMRKIIENLGIDYNSSALTSSITASIGVASIYPSTMESLLTEARSALLTAKKSGKNQICVYQQVPSI
ncbi:diguanylate cyclase domain-containing protein [Psychromonas sp.]|uniref:diguanylate cyclase domain-containing protein n=1 Tax=Psychromonas sp. TaxID=1884585 RepID=UPI0039E5FF62